MKFLSFFLLADAEANIGAGHRMVTKSRRSIRRRAVLVQVARSRTFGRGGVRLHASDEVSHATMITISKEDYLKAIAEAEAERQTVIPATLAHWLSVTRPR